eukprot:4963487-Prymnesium_polylepis.1
MTRSPFRSTTVGRPVPQWIHAGRGRLETTRFFSAHAASTFAGVNEGGEVGVLSVRVCEANDAAAEKQAAWD